MNSMIIYQQQRIKFIVSGTKSKGKGWWGPPHGTHTASKVKDSANMSAKRAADISLPKDTDKYEHFYHSVRRKEDVDSIVKHGIIGGGLGEKRTARKVYLSKDEVRERGGGFVIVRTPTGLAKEGVDVVEKGLEYREWTVDKIPPKDILRTVKMITDKDGENIREDHLAAWFAKGKLTPRELAAVPDKYVKKWLKK